MIKVGDKVKLTRERWRCEGVVIETREASRIHELADLGRGQALALMAETGLVYGIAVKYEFSDNGKTITPVATLVQDDHGRWWDLLGRSVDVERVVEQISLSGPSANAYPD
jgi:hypothetical protein